MNSEIRHADLVTEFHTPEGCWILEIANDTSDPGVSIARARVPPNVTTEWHYLTDIEERYVIVSGRGRVEIGDLPPTTVGPGDVVRIPAATRQRIANDGDADLLFYCVCTPRFVPAAYVASGRQ
jgi:mannose-6-phosphate isomerase-like protein (cupin superfamily)